MREKLILRFEERNVDVLKPYLESDFRFRCLLQVGKEQARRCVIGPIAVRVLIPNAEAIRYSSVCNAIFVGQAIRIKRRSHERV
jgi:hypothetical protein